MQEEEEEEEEARSRPCPQTLRFTIDSDFDGNMSSTILFLFFPISKNFLFIV